MPTILTKKSDTPGSIPATANLTNAAGGAELAVNTADKRLFTINSTSQVVELGTNPSSITCADGSFTVARIGSGTVTQLTSTSATITTLTATSATVTNLTATSIVISNLSIASANITTLTSSSATISTTLALSGGTANGVLYLNGSKVATSGSALTFDGTNFATTALTQFNGNANTLKNNGELQWKDSGGTAQNVLFMFSDNNVYLSSPVASSSLIFRGPSYAELMRLTSTGLLIGNTSGYGVGSAENNSLQAKGPIVLAANNTGSASNRNWVMQTNAAAAGSFSLAYSSTNTGWPNAAYAMVIDSSGNLGIGTSSPGARLDVSQSNPTRGIVQRVFNSATSSQTGTQIQFAQNSVADWVIGQPAGVDAFAFWSGRTPSADGTERMRLDSSGNLGLGVTPSAVSAGDKVVQVGAFLFNDNNNGYGILRYNNFYNGSNDVYYANGTASAFQMAGNAFRWYQAASGTAGNAISFTQAATLDANGNFMVGITSSTHRLQAEVASGADRDIFMASVAGASNGFRVQWVHSTSKIHVNIQNLPTSSAGLPAGTLWNDSGTLKVA